jgi:hypothetical protein
MSQIVQYLILSGFISFLVISCAPTAHAIQEGESAGNAIVVAVGGGFTGKETAYMLTERGVLYEKQGSAFQYKAVLDKRFIRQVFSLYRHHGFSAMTVREPGNKFYSLEMRRGGDRQQLLWGKHPETPDILYRYHRFVWEGIKKHTSLK